MANVRMITRTIEETTCKTLTIDLTTNETTIRNFVTGKVKNPAEALSVIQRKFDNEKRKALYVLEMSVETKLYGMPEDDFIKFAKLLPNRTVTENE